MRTSPLLLGALALAAAACSRLDAPDPVPRSVEPARGYAGGTTSVVIRGDGFVARVEQPASGGPAKVNVSHRAWLGDVELQQVTWIDAHTLGAQVPAGLPTGSLPLEVENPFGRRGRLPDAFEVVATPGAALTATVETDTSVASVGQELRVVVRVTNSGFATARDVTAAVTPASEDGAGASLVGPTPATVATLDPGEALTFTWSCVATAAGHLTLSASSTATDAFSGNAIASPSADAAVAIGLPAGLVATISASRPVVNTGQEVAFTLTVTNGGDAGADLASILPTFSPDLTTTCTAPTPPPPVTIASGASEVFTWTCRSAAAGTLTASATVSGADANSGAPLAATPTLPATVTVVTPAALAATASRSPSATTVNVGQPVTMTFTVSNSGGAAAAISGITPTVTPPSAAACGAPSPAPPYSLSGGASTAFTWTCVPAVQGALTLGGGVAGTDADTGAPLATSATAAPLSVQAPAALAAVVSANATVASTGQTIGVTLLVTNGGASTASISAVTPLTSGTAAATCTAVSPAPPQSIASGGAQTFTWSCTATTAGTLSLSGTATGTDATSGLAISATPSTPATVTVQVRATLTVSAFTASRTLADVGQPVNVSLTLANGGGGSAVVSSAAPTFTPAASGGCTAASPAPPVSIVGGGTATFTWSCTGTAATAATLGVTLVARDANSGTTVPVSATPLALTVQTPAAVTVSSFVTALATVDVGQAVAVSLTLANGGGATANVTAVLPSVSGTSASCTAAIPAPPRTLAGSGTSLTFGWSCTATTAGARSLGVSVSSSDANTGAVSALNPTPLSVTVQTPAALSATLSAPGNPTTVSVGQPLSLSLVVSDSGQATARVTSVTPTVSPAGAAACTTASPAVPLTVSGLGSQTFTWTCTTSAAGTITFGATVGGTDLNTGTALSATASPSVSVVSTVPAMLVATVAASPGTATVGQGIGVTFTLTNGGSGAANITGIAPSATGVAATCGAVSPALPQTIAAGTARAFTWTCTASAPGSLALSGTATGTDATSGLPLSATPATAATVTVQTAPALTVTAFTSSRATADVGQAVSLSLTVANGGGAAAILGTVAPSFTPSASGACTAASPPAPVSIPGGGSATFAWSCTGTAAASATLGVALAATDANSGATAPVSATPLPLTVQTPAALSATAFTASATTATVGQAIGMSLTLTNSGGASAVVSSVVPTVSPPSSAACGAVTPAPPVTIAGGTSRTFSWTCTPSAAGAANLGATAAASDANTGGGLAPAVTGIGVTVVTPAALTASVAIGGNPTVVNVGTPLSITLTVGDTGGAGAVVTGVTPTVSGTGAATCGAPTPAPPAGVASGGTVTFTWSCTPTAGGNLALGATVAGTDAVSGAALAAAASAPVTVQAPAALTASIAASRSVADVGQAVSVTLTLRNTGSAGANVTEVVPSATGAGATCGTPTPAPPQAIAGGASLGFTWSCTASGAGTMSLGAAASGTDVSSGATIGATATPVAVTVQVPASLAVTSFVASPTTIERGQRVGLTLSVQNQGGATAQVSAVTPTIDPAGTGSCTAAAPAPPQTLAGGATLTFTWSCGATVAGNAQLGAAVAATDVNTGAAANASATPIPIVVQTPAALSGAVTGTPSPQLVGQAMTFQLPLSNGGGATANVTGVTVTRNPSGNISCTTPTPAPPQAVPGGQVLTLSWTCTAGLARSYTVGATLTATDALTGAAASVSVTSFTATWATTIAAPTGFSAATSTSIQEPAEVAVVSTDALGDGTPVAAIVGAAGGILVGLDASGGGLVRFDASGAPGTRIQAVLGVDAGATPAANGAWLASAPAATLGAPGCAPGTRGCGPDDEAGLAALAAGQIGGAERIALAGTGAGRYVYLGDPADPLEAAWIDLRAAWPDTSGDAGTALLASGTLDALLVAVGGADGPRVVAIPRPPGPAGMDAIPGVDTIDLGAATAAGAGAPTIAELAGAVHVAASDGIARWDDGWQAATPADAAWTTRSPPPPGASAWPRDRAVPGLAAFGACGTFPCAFAVRSVAGGPGQPPAVPQLWRCAPSGASGACAPGDWTLVAPDPSDPLVTRLGAPGGGPATLVVATARWLYVGLDDELGARLYRAPRAPSIAADFVGRGGCSAATSTCEGLGGNGLGLGATRFAGGVRSDASGVTSLWFLAGDGVGPLRLLRIDD